jgi:hypothetical protein
MIRECIAIVIASEAKQSISRRAEKWIASRFAPERKRFAFVADNDGVAR